MLITTCKCYIANKKEVSVVYTHVQLGLRIVFTAVWAHPPSVFERLVALRVRFERLSLPLGSNFLITAPPQCSPVEVLQRENDSEESMIKEKEGENSTCT